MRRFGHRLAFTAEIIVLSAFVLTTRCANYHDVFIGNHIYFTDADCYARMTRVRLCAQHPGLIVRHHSFENFPEGTAPHTTAPFDYAIVGLSVLLRPFTSRPIDMAGALISPVLGVITAVFLAWWARRIRLPFHWAMLALFALSPILVHGTELGRPDHQSLLILLIIIGVCADLTIQNGPERRWAVVSGIAWGFALWVSLYEPLILFVLSLAAAAIAFLWDGGGKDSKNENGAVANSLTKIAKHQFITSSAKGRWIALLVVLVVALAIERRLPSWWGLVNDPMLRNWSRTIGELSPVRLLDGVWFNWMGWLLIAAPIFLVLWMRRNSHRNLAVMLTLLLVATFCLTMWQARWAYFLAIFFAMAVPGALSLVPSRLLACVLFIGSLWPVLRDWDERLWPNDSAAAQQAERRREAVELRALSVNLISAGQRPFLAPWWLSPAISYWSGQPGVGGSSHEAFPGIADTARFFLSDDSRVAAEILQRRSVVAVIAYDAGRVETNSSLILDKPSSDRCLARLLDQRPAYAPPFLTLVSQNGTAKIFVVHNKW